MIITLEIMIQLHMCGDKMKKILKLEHYRMFSMISIAVFLLTLFVNQIIPLRYELLVAIIALLMLWFVLYRKSRILNIAFIILMLLPTVGLFYSQSIFNRIFDNEKFETEKISFISLTKNKFTIEKIDSTTVFGLSESFDDDNLTHINGDLIKRFDFTTRLVVSDSHMDTIQGMYDGLYQIGIIDNAVIDTILESFPDFQLDFDILWSIERVIKRDDIVKDVDVNKNAFIVLISGIDINGPLSLRSRSDVNILAVVNPDTQTITLVSIPRDMYVPFACKNDALDKLTHSGIYGINCTVQTIENFLDIEINYYVRLNFTSFIKIIDVIGDIQVFSRYTFTAGGYRFVSGMNTLNSQSALSFARERKSFEAGDIQRGLNQQEVIKGVINKIISPSSITKIDQIVNSIAKSIDTNMGSQSVQKLIALQIDKRIVWKFNSFFVDGTGSMEKTYSMPGRNLFVVIPSQESVDDIKAKIKDALK
jgi:polyisoprenyl-teichoic acid--peptidoglycan teichoic acid transferase